MAKHQIDLINTTADVTWDFSLKTVDGVEVVLDPATVVRLGDLASQLNGDGAALVGIEDAGGLFLASDVEAALQELKELADANAAGVGARWTMVDLAVAPAELPNYTGNGAGVGKTLTGDSNGALTLQSYSWQVGDRVLLAAVNADGIGAPFADHGIYDVTDPGDVTSPFVLTRSADADQETDFVQNKVVFIESGTNAGSYYSQGTDGVVVDSTSIVFNRIATSAIPNGAIVTAKIAPLAVTAQKLDADSVTSAKIVDGAVLDAKIDGMAASKLSGSVPNVNISSGSVVQHEGDLSIEESQITDLQAYALDTARVVNSNAIADLETLSGVNGGLSMGAFSGSTIGDSSSVKQALQALETSLENKSSIADHDSNENLIAALTQLTGAGSSATDMGSWTNLSLPADADIKAILEEVGSRIDEGAVNFQALQTAVGASTSSNDTTMVDLALVGGVGSGEKELSAELEAGDALYDQWGIKNIQILYAFFVVELEFTTQTKRDIFLASASSFTIEGVQATVANGVAQGVDKIGFMTSMAPGLFSAMSAAVDWTVTVSDTSAGADLGSFNGSIIADDSTVKVALQALETEVETKASEADLTVAEGRLDDHDADFLGVERFFFATVNYNAGQDVVICDMPAGAQIMEVRVKIKAAFDGVTPMMSVGHDGDESALAPDSEFDLADASAGGNPQTLAAWYENSTQKDFKVYLNLTGATQGQALVGIRYIK